MSVLHAIILGIVQGLSEFLPISSSGHLKLVPWFLGWEEIGDNIQLTFDVALHIGTFVGALIYFRDDVVRIVGAAWSALRKRRIETDDERLSVLLVVASLPAATIGAVLDKIIEGKYGPIWVIGVMLIVFGFVLLWTDRMREERTIGDFRVKHALLMGFAQAAALQPGVSRSGATISMGRYLGFDRDSATRISFLMSLPITFGAASYKMLDMFSKGGIPEGMAPAFAWGIVASGITGFLAVWGLLRLVRTRSFAPFVWYRVALGLVVIAVAALR